MGKSLLLLMLMLSTTTVVLGWAEEAAQEDKSNKGSRNFMDNSGGSSFNVHQKDAKETVTGAVASGKDKAAAAFDQTKEQAAKAYEDVKGKVGDAKGNYEAAKAKASQAAANIGKTM